MSAARASGTSPPISIYFLALAALALRYLTCDPNEKAARDFKNTLLQIYPTILKAWRQLLDRDGSNAVGWDEFEAVGKRLSFKGDLPGAWRFFDEARKAHLEGA